MTYISTKNYGIEVGKGNVPGDSHVQLVGRNRSVGTVYEDVWDGGELSNLAYDNQNSNFTVGDIVTGTNTQATGVIVVDDDNGAGGVLCLRDITKAFEDNEPITGASGGAALANGIDVQLKVQHLPTSGEQWEFICENPNDSSAGSGAQTILFTFIEEGTRAERTEVLSTNGNMASAFDSDDAYRLLSAQVLTWGSATNQAFGKTNLGGIVIRKISTNEVVGYISYDVSVEGDEHGLNRTFSSAYTVEAGFGALPIFVTLNSSKNNDITAWSMIRLDGSEGWTPIAQLSIYQNSFIEEINGPVEIPEKADLKIICRSDNNKILVNTQITLLKTLK